MAGKVASNLVDQQVVKLAFNSIRFAFAMEFCIDDGPGEEEDARE
jgi:hypothetical protein